MHDLSDHITSSYLWVLGVYELVRTLDQFAKKDDSPLNHMRDEIQTYKRKINRLRIPLAKMEAASSNPDDSPIAYPGVNRYLGLAWQLMKMTGSLVVNYLMRRSHYSSP